MFSWLAVCFMAVVYHSLRFFVILIEDLMVQANGRNCVPKSTALYTATNVINIPSLTNRLSPKIGSPDTTYQRISSPEDNCCGEMDEESGIGEEACCSSNLTKGKPSIEISSQEEGEGSMQFLRTTKYRMFLRLGHSLTTGLTYAVSLLLMLVAMTFNPSLFVALVVGYTAGDFIFFSRIQQHYFSDCHS